MSLVVNPQPDGSILISCGDYTVVIPPRGDITPPVFVPPPPVPGHGTVVVQLGPGPEGSVRPDAPDLETIVNAIPDDLVTASIELESWPEAGIDVEALMSATRERFGAESSIDLHFLSRDE